MAAATVYGTMPRGAKQFKEFGGLAGLQRKGTTITPQETYTLSGTPDFSWITNPAVLNVPVNTFNAKTLPFSEIGIGVANYGVTPDSVFDMVTEARQKALNKDKSGGMKSIYDAMVRQSGSNAYGSDQSRLLKQFLGTGRVPQGLDINTVMRSADYGLREVSRQQQRKQTSFLGGNIGAILGTIGGAALGFMVTGNPAGALAGAKMGGAAGGAGQQINQGGNLGQVLLGGVSGYGIGSLPTVGTNIFQGLGALKTVAATHGPVEALKQGIGALNPFTANPLLTPSGQYIAPSSVVNANVASVPYYGAAPAGTPYLGAAVPTTAFSGPWGPAVEGALSKVSPAVQSGISGLTSARDFALGIPGVQPVVSAIEPFTSPVSSFVSRNPYTSAAAFSAGVAAADPPPLPDPVEVNFVTDPSSAEVPLLQYAGTGSDVFNPPPQRIGAQPVDPTGLATDGINVATRYGLPSARAPFNPYANPVNPYTAIGQPDFGFAGAPDFNVYHEGGPVVDTSFPVKDFLPEHIAKKFMQYETGTQRYSDSSGEGLKVSYDHQEGTGMTPRGTLKVTRLNEGGAAELPLHLQELQKREHAYYTEHPIDTLTLTPTGKVTQYNLPIYEDQHGGIHSESSETFQLPNGKWITFSRIFPDPETGEARYFDQGEIIDQIIIPQLQVSDEIRNPVNDEVIPLFDTESEATRYALERDHSLQRDFQYGGPVTTAHGLEHYFPRNTQGYFGSPMAA